jgi:hypothetical protein
MAENRPALSSVALPREDDPFGIWDEVPGVGVSFGADASGAWAEPNQRIRLPASHDQALAFLDGRRRALERGTVKLGEAQQRMARVGEGWWDSEEVSFAALAGPEDQLRAVLNATQALPSFSLAQEDAEQKENRHQWRAFVTRVKHMIAHPTRVETQVGRTLVGYTAVGWTGDFDTRWQSGVAPQSMELHHRTLQLVLGKRAARLRLLVVVSTGAARLALQLTTPGAQLRVLPATWKFVRDVLKELQ